MISPRKYLKKLAMATALAGCLFGSFASAAFAAVDAGSLNNQVGNELQASFNVTEAVENTVVISWDAAGLNLGLDNYDLIKNETKTITYYVSPGANNDDDLTVSVLLKAPLSSYMYVQSVEVEGALVQNGFVDGDHIYYVLKEGLEVEVASMAYIGNFDIAFNTASTGGPFSASLIAVKEGLKSTPSFVFTDSEFSDGQYESLRFDADGSVPPADWYSGLTVSYSKDGGQTYTAINWVDDYSMDAVQGWFIFYGQSMPDTNSNWIVHYKFVSPGYEDVIVYFAD